MRRGVPVLALLACAGSLALALPDGDDAKRVLPRWRPGEQEGTVVIDGNEESFLALVPRGYTPRKPVPVVLLAFHHLALPATHQRLRSGPLNFVGNVEGRDVMSPDLDVCVTDGFTGNVALKTLEGTARTIIAALLAELDQPLMSSTLLLPDKELPETDAWDIRERLEHQVDLVIDSGSCGVEPTTVIDLADAVPTVTRQGKGSTEGLE